MAVQSTTLAGILEIPAASLTDAHLSGNANISRTKQALNSQDYFGIPVHLWRQVAAGHPVLGTAGSTNLGVGTAAAGATGVDVRTSPSNGTTITQTAMFEFYLPPEYAATTNIYASFWAAMNVISSASCTLDITAYKVGTDGAHGSDLNSTSAIDIRTVTYAERVFTIDGSGLSPGDKLEIYVTVAATDGGGAGTDKYAKIVKTGVKCDCRG